jgi:aspartyl-tRNA(Asn)/glutamyl-tRNA(Gln) amidotransferase subunit A
MDELDGLDGPDIGRLAGLLQRREVSPVELASHTLDRIAARDEWFHAFVTITRERALREAARAEREIADGEWRGPLHGIPYAVKDLFDVAGEATGAGTHLLAGAVADADATVVRRLGDAGMVLVGKTHTVQFAYGGVGINHDTGTPRNPWGADVHHVPGGSSSGSAVAVAAGLVPVALGTDTSGSVRVPASLCGDTGLKTTVGRVSRAGVYPLSRTLDSVGPLAGTIADCALVYAALRGADAGDPATAGQTPDDVSADLDVGVSGMRLAFVETMFFDDVDPEVVSAVRAAGEVLDGLGAEVTSIEAPEIDGVMGGDTAPHRARTVGAEGYAVNRRFLEESFDELDPVVAHRMLAGSDVLAVDYLEAFEAWRRIEAAFAARTAGIDAFLVPATMLPARTVAEVDASPATYARFNRDYLRNTSIGNRLGWCGVSVPCGFTTDGLPIGLMIHAPAMHEHVVLRAGHAYQLATDWHRRRPAP